MDIVTLTEDDIPGARLDEPGKANMEQLKRWLKCRGIKVSGRRAELVQRVQDAKALPEPLSIISGIDGGKWYDAKLKRKGESKTRVISTISLLNRCPKRLLRTTRL